MIINLQQPMGNGGGGTVSFTLTIGLDDLINEYDVDMSLFELANPPAGVGTDVRSDGLQIDFTNFTPDDVSLDLTLAE